MTEMDIPSSLAAGWHSLLSWWTALAPWQALVLRILLLLLWLLAGGWLGYYLIRLGLGHRRFRGRWYGAQEWQLYMQELERRDRAGLPLNYDEAGALDGWRAASRQ